MFDAAMLRLHKDKHIQAVTMLFAGCTQQECAYTFGENISTVQQLNMRLHHLDSADYTPGTGCPQVTIPRQGCQIRLPHMCSYFTTAVQTAATITGRGNRCVSVQNVRNRL
jgi:hypothetical protein